MKTEQINVTRNDMEDSNIQRGLAAADDARVSAWRRETRGCANVNHLNNAGAALMPAPVADAMRAHIDLEESIGGYEAADARSDAVEAAHRDLGRIVGAESRNIAITASATASFIQAISSFDFNSGDVIVTSRSDYTSYQIQLLALQQRLGVRVEHAEDLPEGGIDPESVRAILERTRPRFVSVSWVPTHSGIIQDVKAVGEVCASFGVPYHVDACQAVGQMPVNVAELRCDYLSATGRKFLRGPRGSGFLYASDAALARGDFPLFIDMRGAEWTSAETFRVHDSAIRYEDWEFAYACVLGLGAAAAYALAAGIDVAHARSFALAAHARRSLASIPGMRILDRGREQCAIVTFDAAPVAADDIVRELKRARINAVVTRRWYGLLDFSARNVVTGVRVSPHYYNTVEEVDAMVAVVSEMVTRAS